MKVSIITATFNSEKSIEKCIRSVLDQSYSDIEHIIIDNLSSDKTLHIIKTLYNEFSNKKPVIISEKDTGISSALNKGIESSSGDIIGFLHSDDELYHKEAITEVVKGIQSGSYDFVHGSILFIDNELGSNIRRPLMCSLAKAMPYNHPTMYLKKEIYQKFGLYNEHYKVAMDFEFICRLYQTPQYAKINALELTGKPVVKMNAGGISWRLEQKALDETSLALSEYFPKEKMSVIDYRIKDLKLKIKIVLKRLGLSVLVKFWRKLKWRN